MPGAPNPIVFVRGSSSTRKPCRGCGGEKDRGSGCAYCSACASACDGPVASPEPCAICGGEVPAGTKQERIVCDRFECRQAVARWSVSRTAHVRRALRENATGERQCKECGGTFPLTREFFPPGGNYRERNTLRRWCWPCWREHRKAAINRYAAKARVDPELRARHAVNERIRRYLERERLGVARCDFLPNVIEGYQPAVSGSSDRKLPAAPLRVWLDVYLRGRGCEDVAADSGLPSRRIRAVVGREQRTVTLNTADRLVSQADRIVRISEADVAAELRRLEEHWREAPGNGTRVLGYLDDAERIAYLAGATVSHIDDLWPDL